MAVQLRYQDIFEPGASFFVAQTIFSKQGSSTEHLHDFYEVFFVMYGSILHVLNGSSKVLNQGDICLIHPSDTHQFIKQGKDKLASIVNIAITNDYLDEVLTFLYGKKESVLELSKSKLIGAMEWSFVERQLHKIMNQEDEHQLQAEIKVILIQIFSMLKAPRRSAINLAPAWLTLACNQLATAEHLNEGLPALIRFSGRTQEHLTRTMRGFMHTTPTAFINKLRLERAAFLLKTSGDGVATIAYNCGFGNVSHFNKLFRELFYCTPREFRKGDGFIITAD